MDKQTAVQPEEEMAPGEKNAPTESTKPRDVVRIKARSKKKENKKGKKSNMHPLIGKDVWTLGMTKFGEKDYVGSRKERASRLKRKIQLRKCIINHIDGQTGETKLEFMPDQEKRPSWQRHIRSRRNNLGLK